MCIDEVEGVVAEVHIFLIIDTLAVGHEILVHEVIEVHFARKTAFLLHPFA